MTKAEVQIKTGIDNSSIAQGMRDLNTKVKGGAETLRSEVRAIGKELGDMGKFIKGFGAVGFVNQIVSALAPATEAVAQFFGKWTSGFGDGEGRIKAWERGMGKFVEKMKEWRKEREAIAKETAELSGKIQEAGDKNKLIGATPEEVLAIKQEKLRDAMRKQEFTIGGNEAERARLQLEFQEAKNEYDEALLRFAEARDKKEQEVTKELEKQAKKEKEINENIERQVLLSEKLNKQRMERDRLSQRQQLEKFMPGLDAIASDPNSYGYQDANRLKFLQEDTTRVLRTYGARGADQNYLKANQDEMSRLEKSLQDRGFLHEDNFEKAAAAAEETADLLETIVKEGLNLKEKA